jgi:dGTPase
MALKDLRSFMFERVYRNPVAKSEESKAKDMLQRMFEFYVKRPEALPEDFQPQLSFDGMERTVCDYIAGMTDNYAVDKFSEIFIPICWNVR